MPMPSITVNLGGVIFQNLEVPETIPWGGDQSLAIQKLVGGQRVIDAMGRDDMAMAWEGLFLGADSLSRAQTLNAMRIAGQAISLTWDQLNFTVVIRTFEPNYAYAYRIPYKITCEVVQDNASPQVPANGPDVDSQMTADTTSATTITGSIGDSTLSTLMGAVSTAIGAVSSFVNASAAAVASVLTPIAAAQARVSTLFSASLAITANVSTVGGVLPGVPVAQNVAALAAQSAAYQQQPLLLNLQSLLGRMATNAASVNNNNTTLTVAGGDLQVIAAAQYGDANAWTGIADANGLTDPQLSGLNTLIIPQTPADTGGTLGVQ